MKERNEIFNSKSDSKVIQNLVHSLEDYISISFTLLCCGLFIRFYEAILLTFFQGYFWEHLWWNTQGSFDDIFLFLKLSFFLIPIFFIISFLSRKFVNIFFRLFFALMILFSLICVTFFSIAGYFLDATVFSYSVKEMMDIMKASTPVPFWSYIVMIALPLLFYIFSRKRYKISIPLIVCFIAIMVISFFIPSSTASEDESSYVKANKELFFWKNIFNKQKTIAIVDHEQLGKLTDEFRSYFPQFNFKERKYPFLHEADYKDVLSPFFNLNETPPNIVLILIEGFSQEVLDPRYELMPFFTSLSEQGLSWNNCWSTSARTFGAFPALFGALPLGRNGFMALSPYTPSYYSLLKVLKQNGYNSSFLYGGWYGFDNMDLFMKENGVDCILSNWDADIEEESMGFAWGKEDHLMFRQAIRNINFDTSQPRMDIYLTLSSHDPWEYPDKEARQNDFEKRISKYKNISVEEKNKHVFAAFNYIDDALEQLFNDYKSKAGYENTIFIVTGDHSPMTRQLRGPVNFHVPFVIWSPMIKQPKNMQGVITHGDFTPTILSMLQNVYDFEVPQRVAWLNSSMDTSTRIGTAKTFMPFYSSDRDLIGVLLNEYMLCDDMLYKYEGNALLQVDDNEKKESLKRLIALDVALDDYIYKNDLLIQTNDRELVMNKVYIDEQDSISESGYFVKKLNLPIVKAPKSNSNALFFNEEEYIDLFSYEIENNNITAFRVDIDFDIYTENKNLDPIFFVKDFKKENASWLSDEFKYESHYTWGHYNFSFTFRKDRHGFFENDKYSMYIWNPKKVKGYIDNIKVRCIYEESSDI
jgi:uncharacterized sulfatase